MTPSPNDTPIRRYLTLAKFIDLIKSKELFFNALSECEDKHEGDPSYLELIQEIKLAPRARRATEEQLEDMRLDVQAENRSKFINCWNKGPSESMAMWKLYAVSEEGVAIRSTVGRLKVSLAHEPKVKVIDVDYDADRKPIDEPAARKRKCYAYEEEVRAIYTDETVNDNVNLKYLSLMLENEPNEYHRHRNKLLSKEPLSKTFHRVKVDLETLVDAVELSPVAKPWIADVVQSLIIKYDFDIKVLPSSITQVPSWKRA